MTQKGRVTVEDGGGVASCRKVEHGRGLDNFTFHNVLIGTQGLEIFEINESIGLFRVFGLEAVEANFPAFQHQSQVGRGRVYGGFGLVHL
jgi:hypothetical protein